MAIELIPLANATVALAPPIMIPNGPLGTRLIVEVQGFDLEGERIRAHQKGVAGADWALATPDGKLSSLDVRVTLETDDGALIYAHYTGRLDLSEGFGARPVYTAPLFETGDERYAWLNRIQAVAKGTLSSDLSTLTYEIYEVR
jgi:hypothetical protein